MSYLRIRWLHCGGFGVEGHRVQDPLSHPKATLHTSLRELHGGTCQSSKGKTYAWNLWLRSHRRIPAQLGFLQITESSGSQTAVCELGLASDVNTQVILHLLFSHSTSPKHWLLTACFCHLYKWSYTVFSLPCLPPFTHAMFERHLCSWLQLFHCHCCKDVVSHSCVFLYPEDGHLGCIHFAVTGAIVANTHLIHAFGGTWVHISVGSPF